MNFFVHALFHHAVARIVLYSYPNRKCEPIREVLAYTELEAFAVPSNGYSLGRILKRCNSVLLHFLDFSTQIWKILSYQS